MTDYWLPTWWDWEDCATCLEYNHTPCASCEIPPGILAMAQLVGGGVATVGGSMRGNVGIASQQQAVAAARQHSVEEVEAQLNRQQQAKLQRGLNQLDR